MFFPFFILTRLLFIASMVFILGYLFGGFSKRPVLARMAKIGSIVVIVLFIGTGVFFMRGGGWQRHGWHNGYGRHCGQDTAVRN